MKELYEGLWCSPLELWMHLTIPCNSSDGVIGPFWTVARRRTTTSHRRDEMRYAKSRSAKSWVDDVHVEIGTNNIMRPQRTEMVADAPDLGPVSASTEIDKRTDVGQQDWSARDGANH
jgi:hypothetical protein